MKKTMTFIIPASKTRAHRVLFDDDLPFKHKVEKSKKNQYQRRPKHRNQLGEE